MSRSVAPRSPRALRLARLVLVPFGLLALALALALA
jgi:hypothetical protein